MTEWRREELCDSCLEAIRVGRARLEKTEREATADGVLVRLQSYWPTIYHDYGVIGKALDALARACLSLAKERPYATYEELNADRPVPAPRPLPDDQRAGWFSTCDPKAEARRGPRRVVDAIERLDIAVRASISKAHEDGLAEGRNILLQLAQGKIAMEEISEETIKAAKIKRRRK